MAKRIEGPYDFSHYHFGTYADGATWELIQGEDLTVGPATIVQNARKWGQAEGLEVDTKVIEGRPQDPTIVAVRFRKRPSIRAVGD